MANDFPAILKKQVGPLPLGVWVLAVGAGIGLSQLSAKRNASNGTSLPVAAEPSPDLQGRDVTIVDNGAQVQTGRGTFADNTTWQQAALAWCIAKGISPILAGNALNRYLDGVALDNAETGVITRVLAEFGPPPIPAPLTPPIAPPPVRVPVKTTPPPATLPKPATKPDGYYEFFVGSPVATDNNRGAWYLTNLGGIYAAGTARYRGGLFGKLAAGEYAVSLAPSGAGYAITTNKRTVTY